LLRTSCFAFALLLQKTQHSKAHHSKADKLDFALSLRASGERTASALQIVFLNIYF